MFKSARSMLVAFSVCVISSPVAAEPIYGVLNLGLDFGGDTLITVYLTDGSTDSIEAGTGVYISGGLGTTFSEGKYDGQVTFGYKTTGISASNGSLDWTRFPLEVLGYYNYDKLRLGGGITYHLNSTLEGTGVAAGEFNFDDSLGYILEGQYRSTDQMSMGLRMTMLKYKVGSASIDGGSFGLSMTFAFLK